MASPGGSSGGGGQSGGRLLACLGGIPLATRLVVGINLAVYVYSPLLYSDVEFFYTNNAYYIWYKHEFYRIVASAFFHANLLHIAMNMAATWWLLNSLEQRFGTACTLGMVAQFSVFAGLIFTSLCYVGLENWSSMPEVLCGPAIGFSGVIFSLLIVDTALLPEGARRNLFGCFNMPAWAYPWVLCAIFNPWIFKGISFMGHLCGIFAGLLYAKGFMNPLSLKRSWIRAAEARLGLDDGVVYVPCPAEPLIPDPYSNFRCGFCRVMAAACAGTCAEAAALVGGLFSGVRARAADRAAARRQQRNAYEPIDMTDDLEMGGIGAVQSGSDGRFVIVDDEDEEEEVEEVDEEVEEKREEKREESRSGSGEEQRAPDAAQGDAEQRTANGAAAAPAAAAASAAGARAPKRHHKSRLLAQFQ